MSRTSMRERSRRGLAIVLAICAAWLLVFVPRLARARLQVGKTPAARNDALAACRAQQRGPRQRREATRRALLPHLRAAPAARVAHGNPCDAPRVAAGASTDLGENAEAAEPPTRVGATPDKHRLTKDTDRAGLSFRFRYDREDRCIESWGDYGGKRDPSLADDVPEYLADKTTKAKGVHHCKFDYMEGDYTEVADSTNVERYFGNKFGTLDKSVIGGATTTSRYDERGFMVEQMDALEAVTKWKRDERGRVLEVVDPLGRTKRVERDVAGLPVKVTDPAGGVTTAHRDARGNLQVVTDPVGAVTSLTCDERGLVTAVTEPTGATTHYAYDAHGNLTGIQHPNGGVWRFAYDGFGRRTTAIDPTGAETRYTYNNRGDLLAVYDAVGGVTRYSYDGESHLTQIVSPKGYVTQLYWGGYHKLSGRRDANGHLARLAYNREGELVEVHNERDEIHRLFYDPSGNLIAEETFDQRRLTYKNDPLGRPIHIENGAGQATDLEYDPAGQLVAREFADDSEAFEYNARGELVFAKNGAGEFRFERDGAGRVVRESQQVAGTEHWVTATYDLAGARTYRETSLGHSEHVQRDAMGARVRTLLDGNHQIDHVNDVLSRESQRRLPGGGMIESGFDRMGRLAQRAVRSPVKHRPVGSDEPEWVGGVPEGVTAYTTYQYDLDGELIEKSDLRQGKTEYRYDPVGQLLALVPARAREELFRYDPTGNIYEAGDQDPGRTYGRGSRLLRKGNTQYEWDEDGRLSRKREVAESGERVWQYTWNGAGLLQRVDTPEGERVEFSYDPFARRVEKRVVMMDADREIETATRFVWDGDVLAHEVRWRASESGDEIVEERAYVFEDGQFAPLVHSLATPEEGASQRTWLHYSGDPIGTPAHLSRADGTIVEVGQRSAWGARLQDGTSVTPIGFPGQYADSEIALAYNRWRYYDPAAGAYISPDPAGILESLNSFAYAPNPFAWTDVFGLALNRQERQRLQQIRREQQLPPIGSSHNTQTVALLTMPDGSQHTGFSSAVREDHVHNPYHVNSITPTHAEGDALNQAAQARGCRPRRGQRGSRGGTRGGHATMIVDRPPCGACGRNGGIRSMTAAAGLDSLTVHYPHESRVFTPDGPANGTVVRR